MEWYESQKRLEIAKLRERVEEFRNKLAEEPNNVSHVINYEFLEGELGVQEERLALYLAKGA